MVRQNIFDNSGLLGRLGSAVRRWSDSTRVKVYVYAESYGVVTGKATQE